jgi:hypothetical protein
MTIIKDEIFKNSFSNSTLNKTSPIHSNFIESLSQGVNHSTQTSQLPSISIKNSYTTLSNISIISSPNLLSVNNSEDKINKSSPEKSILIKATFEGHNSPKTPLSNSLTHNKSPILFSYNNKEYVDRNRNITQLDLFDSKSNDNNNEVILNFTEKLFYIYF